MNETQRNHYSFVNQPDIVVVSAADDNTNTNQGNYTRFQVINSAPILEAKACALVRATIPLGKQQLPDYCCVFYYHRIPAAGSRSASTVKAIRFLPFGRVVASATNYAINRYISSYSDLVSLLNQAAANDDTTTNPLFVANDVSFTLTANKQITMTGLIATYTYAPAAYDDPYVAAAIAATPITFPGSAADKNNNVTLVATQTLNMRCGFSQPYRYTDAVPSLTAVASGTAIPADAFPNLVYTNTIRLYSNLAGSAGMTSDGSKNLLAVLPVNAPPLGVLQYESPHFAFLTKLPDTIYSITLEMRDDFNQPFYLPDNNVAAVELQFKY